MINNIGIKPANSYRQNISFKSSKIPIGSDISTIIPSSAIYTKTNRSLFEIKRLYPPNLLSSFELLSGKTILDVGAGSCGKFVTTLRLKGALKLKKVEVYGIDKNFNKILRTLLKSFLKEADAQKIPFKNDFFDLVYSTQSIFSYGTENIELQAAVLKEIHRVLKPDGKFRCSPVTQKDMINIIEKAGLTDTFEIISPIKKERSWFELKKITQK